MDNGMDLHDLGENEMNKCLDEYLIKFLSDLSKKKKKSLFG